MPVLTAALTRLRSDFNTLAPERDKRSDGWIGDAAHAAGTSGHNAESSGKSESNDHDSIDEVRALDVDADLRQPGITMLKCVQKILASPNDLKRLKYIIFNRVIWSASNGWRPRAYNGPNPHTEHAHFSGNYSYDSNTSAWAILALQEDDVTPEQWAYIQQALTRIDKQSAASAARSDGVLLLDDVKASWSSQTPDAVEVNELREKLNLILAVATAGKEPIDPTALLEAIKAGLTVALTDPAVVQGIAEAVADEQYRRQAE